MNLDVMFWEENLHNDLNVLRISSVVLQLAICKRPSICQLNGCP